MGVGCVSAFRAQSRWWCSVRLLIQAACAHIGAHAGMGHYSKTTRFSGDRKCVIQLALATHVQPAVFHSIKVTYSTPYLTVHDLCHRDGSITMECRETVGDLVLHLRHAAVESASQVVLAAAMRSRLCASLPMHLETL